MFLYQIEVSNVCNLRCPYCPHPGQRRRKGLMSFDTFRDCIDLYCICQNTMPLHLHNFGEVTLHPELPRMIRHARDHGVRVRFYTNGLGPNLEPHPSVYWQNLADHGLEEIHFSSHQMSLAEFEAIIDGILVVNAVFDPRTSRMGTWAGQTGPAEAPPGRPCIFERMPAFVVLWDGRISACCLDVEGQRMDLNVRSLLASGSYQYQPIPLCATCGSMRGQVQL
jgi:hypothetical protein